MHCPRPHFRIAQKSFYLEAFPPKQRTLQPTPEFVSGFDDGGKTPMTRSQSQSSRQTCEGSIRFLRHAIGFNKGFAYQRLIQAPPPPPPRRLIQPPPPPPRLIHPPPPPPRPLIHPPPPPYPRRLIQPALASGDIASQAAPNTTAAIAAPDHLPMVCRKMRRRNGSVSSSVPVVSCGASLFIKKEAGRLL